MHDVRYYTLHRGRVVNRFQFDLIRRFDGDEFVDMTHDQFVKHATDQSRLPSMFPDASIDWKELASQVWHDVDSKLEQLAEKEYA